MPTFLESLFNRAKPTYKIARAALDRVEADLAAAPARIAAAERALRDIAGLSDEEHTAAEAELGAARRAAGRLEQQAGQLRAAVAEAERADAAAALAARAQEAMARLRGYGPLIDRHDTQAAALAATLAEMEEIERAIAATNRAIAEANRAGLEAPAEVETPDAKYRAEPDVVTPDRIVVEDRVVCVKTVISYDADGNPRHSLHETPVAVTEKRGGKLILQAGEQIRQVSRTIAGSTTRGRRCSSPTVETSIAAARIGRPAFWPRQIS